MIATARSLSNRIQQTTIIDENIAARPQELRTVQRKDLVRNLIIMATADGSLTEREIKLLAHRCEAWGVSEHEFAELLENSLAEKSRLNLPVERQQREELLTELVHMMAADGRLAESEKRLFAIVAVAMDFANDEIQDVIDRALEQ